MDSGAILWAIFIWLARNLDSGSQGISLKGGIGLCRKGGILSVRADEGPAPTSLTAEAVPIITNIVVPFS